MIVYATTVGSGDDLYTASRSDAASAFGAATPLAAVNTPNGDTAPFLSADGLRLVFASNGSGTYKLFEATRPTRVSAFSASSPLHSLDSANNEYSPTLSVDALDIFFASDRPGLGKYDIYGAHRPALDQPFGPAQLVPELSTPFDDCCMRLSPGGSTIYFNYNTDMGGTRNADFWTATRTCN